MFASPWSRMYVRFQLAIFCLLTLIVATPTFGQSAPIFPILGTYSIPSAATAFATGDFNGDGKTDLVYLGQPLSGKTSVNVLLYQGPTTDPIAVTTDNISCTAVSSVAAADMNKDGKLDVVLGCTEGVALELYGNGDGTFQTPVIALLNGPAANLAIGDFNADGYPDLAVLVNNGSYSIATLLNQGGASAGTLTPAGTRSLQSAPAISTMKTGDFNGDGKLDVLVASYNAPYVAFGNGDGTLLVPQSMAATGCARVEVGDFNRDGITDAACVNSTHGDYPTFSLQVLLGSSSGQFAVASSLPLQGNSIPVAIGSNGDGNADLAVVGDATSIMLGDGHGAFSFGQSYAITGTPIVVNPDDNGRASLVFYSSLNGSYALRYLTANGDGTFQGPPNQPIGSNTIFGSTLFVNGDLNGDGISDIAYLDSQQNFIVALGRGNGTFTVTNQLTAIPGQALSLLVMGDFDGDGKMDIVAIASGGGTGHGNQTAVNSREYFYKGNGDGTVTLSGSPQEIAIFGPYGPIVGATGDFNGDNKLDAVIGYYNMSNSPPVGTGFIVLAGNGDGTFNPSAPVSGGNSAAPMLVGDMNGDHKLDLVWGQSVYLSNGDGTFTLFPMSLQIPDSSSPLASAECPR